MVNAVGYGFWVIEFEAALEVFVRGFALTKSWKDEYAVRAFPLGWIMHDTRRRLPRRSEVVTPSLDAQAVRTALAAEEIGKYFLCPCHTLDVPEKSVRDAYRAAGFRILGAHALFVHDLREIGPAVHVYRVPDPDWYRTLAPSDAVKRSIRRMEGDKEGRLRRYAALDQNRLVGWVLSVPVGEYTWVSDLYVEPSCRGRGLGAALMNQMLLDDRELGVKASVLLASKDGARLYPHLGYEPRGTVQLTMPRS